MRVRSILTLLGIVFLCATTARAETFTFTTPIAGDSVTTTVTATNLTTGSVQVTVSIPSGQGDLLGFFGNVVDESVLPQMTVTNHGGLITQTLFKANKVDKVGGGNTMAPVKTWDFGMQIGHQGSSGGAILTASFQLNAPGLTVSKLINASTGGWVFGVRIQSTAGPEGSSKMGLSSSQAPDATNPPDVRITSPADGLLTNNASITVTGTVTNSTNVTVNGLTATVTNGTFTRTLTLVEGANVITARATNTAPTAATDQVTVKLDTTPPVVAFTAPPENQATSDTSALLTGTVTDANPITSFTLANVATPLVDGAFSAQKTLAVGTNTFEARATDAAGNVGTAVRHVVRGNPPQVSLSAPAAGSLLNTPTIAVSGSAPGATAVTVNGVSATLNTSTGAFSAQVPLVEGANTLVALATNAFGQATDSRPVTLDTIPPQVTFVFPTDGAQTPQASVAVFVTATDANPITTFTMNGSAATLEEGQFFEFLSLAAGANTFTARATDAAGNIGTAVLHVQRGALPQLGITTPTDGRLLNTPNITVTGTSANATSVKVNGVTATLGGGGSWTAPIHLSEGANTLTAIASNVFGDAAAEVSVTLDTIPPVVEIVTPGEGQQLTETKTFVGGQVRDASPIASLTLNGTTLPAGNAFGAVKPLGVGANTFTATATDAAGNVGTDIAHVQRVLQPLDIQILSPADTSGSQLTALPPPDFDNVGTPLTFDENGIAAVPFTDGFQVSLFGQTYDSVEVDEFGTVRFGTFVPEPDAADTRPFVGPLEQLIDHERGQFGVQQLSDRLVFTFVSPQPGLDEVLGINRYQLTIFADGTIRIGYGSVVQVRSFMRIRVASTGEGSEQRVDFSARGGQRGGDGVVMFEEFPGANDLKFDLVGYYLFARPSAGGTFQTEVHPFTTTPPTPGVHLEATQVSGLVGFRQGDARLDLANLGDPVALELDQSVEVPFTGSFAFPFFGTTYHSVFLNAAGNLTFGAPDPGTLPSTDGPPRILALFSDLNPSVGQVHVRQLPDRFVLTVSAPQLGSTAPDDLYQATLFADGTIQLGYGTVADVSDAAIGISPGGIPEPSLVDWTASNGVHIDGGTAFAEAFLRGAEVDLQGSFLLFHPDGAGYRVEVQSIAPDPEVSVDVNGVPAAVRGNVFSAIVPLAVGENTLVATAVDPDATATDSVTVTRLPDEDDDRVRLILVDPGRSPKGGFGTDSRPVVAHGEEDFRAYLDTFGLPPNQFFPPVHDIAISGENETLIAFVFATSDTRQILLRHVPLDEITGLPRPGEARTIRNTGGFFVLDQLADALLSLGLDPGLAATLPPSDFEASFFDVVTFPLCRPSSPQGYGYGDDKQNGDPACLRGRVQLDLTESHADSEVELAHDSLEFSIDEVAPQVAIAFPPQDSTVGGSFLTARGALSDLLTFAPDGFDAGGSLFQQVNYELFEESGGVSLSLASGSGSALADTFELPGIPLAPGSKRLVIRAIDAAGNLGQSEVRFSVDASGAANNAAPRIVSTPTVVGGQGAAYAYRVQATDANPADVVTFSLDRAPAGMTIEPFTGTIAWTPTNAQVGANAVVVRASDGNLASLQSFSVTVANANDAPQITSSAVLTAREELAYAYDVDAADPDAEDTLTFSLTQAPAAMTIDPASGLITWTPAFADVGSVPVTVKVTDADGLFATQTFSIQVAEKPRVELSINSPRNGSITSSSSVTLAGTVNRATAVVTVNGTPVTLTGTAFSVPGIPLAPGSNVIRVRATFETAADAVDVTVFRDTAPTGALPPDPSTVAPPIDITVATTNFNATQFLYSGAHPIQTGVAPGTIDPVRSAVLRGRVKTRDDVPLSATRVSVLEHPEFGETLTRADGWFDLAVNGGGLLILQFERAGLITSQRQVDVPAQDFSVIDDVVLVPYDGNVTQVNLSTLANIAVHRATVVKDRDGSRQATLLFKPGTSASLVRTDGSHESLDTIHVRATEYTVGSNGPQAMPAVLPPTSAYTYAVELSVDEAIGSDVRSVDFSHDVTLYLENFLHFPAGTVVPLGYYDRERGVWVPSNNGRVAKILNVTGGVASVDLDGDGVDGAAETGVDPAERAQLGALYPAGTTLWRVGIPHFTPWDCNWPYRLPVDAAFWPGSTQNVPQNLKPTEKKDQPKPNPCKGCEIEVENMVGKEEIDLQPVSDMHYAYSTFHVDGNTGMTTATFNLGGSTVPPTLSHIQLDVEIAGQHQRMQFPPDTKQTEVEWDGKDAYGRKLQGGQPMRAQLSYVYQPDYTKPPDFTRSFGAFPEGGVLLGVPARNEALAITPVKDTLGTLRASAFKMGGWGIDAQHRYDPVSKVLHLGNGERRNVDGIASGIFTIAGSYGQPGDEGDGGLATAAKLSYPASVAVGPDGAIYIADGTRIRRGGLIRRIDPDGSIATVAGGGSSFCEDCRATNTWLDNPQGIAIGRDGLYIAESDGARVRRVDALGNIHTVAGTGSSGTPTEGVFGRSSQLVRPYGVAIAPDGSLYIADGKPFITTNGETDNNVLRVDTAGSIRTVFRGTANPCPGAHDHAGRNIALGPDGSLYIPQGCRLQRMRPDGAIQTVAGSGFMTTATFPIIVETDGLGYAGDGEAASRAKINAQWVAVAPDGTVYLAEDRNDTIVFEDGHAKTFVFCEACVRAIDPDGVITTVAGGKPYDPEAPAPADQLPKEASFAFGAVPAVGPDGTLYLADIGNHVVRKVVSPLPGFTNSGILVPSESGAEIYRFDALGRHQETLNALTGQVLRGFGYNGAGELTTVTDANSNVTTFDRNGSGRVTAVHGPFGKTSTLSYDGNGLLQEIRNPLGQKYTLGYQDAGGLLNSYKTPKGEETRYAYDTKGRLVREDRPDGSGLTLTRIARPNEVTIDVENRTGQHRTFAQVELADNKQSGAVLDPAGFELARSRTQNATSKIVAPDGTTLTQTNQSSSGFGMLAPILRSLDLQTPGGRTQHLELDRETAFRVPGDPTSGVASRLDQITIDGKTGTIVFDAVNGTRTLTTPLGRTLQNTLDAQGRVIRTELPGSAPALRSYDLQGRLEGFARGDGPGARISALAYGSDGLLESVTDPAGRVRRYERDAAGRVLRQVLEDGRAILYTYDANGDVSSITPPGRAPHVFQYAPRGPDQSLAQYVPPAVDANDPSTLYQYDTAGRLDRVERPGGSFVDYDYDAAGQLTRLVTPRGTTQYLYETQAGRLAEAVAPGGERLTYAFDADVLAGRSWSGTVNGTVGTSHDGASRLIAETINGGSAVTRAYDDDGLLVRAGNLTIGHDASNGDMISSQLGVVTESLSYDAFRDYATRSFTINASSVYSQAFTRDALGRITRQVETVQGTATTLDYSYDPAGRLIGVTENGSTRAEYAYDDNSNRLTKTESGATTTGSYDGQDRLISYGNEEFTYAPSGELATRTNLLNGDTTTYAYDPLGNLGSVSLPNGTRIDYVIDAENRRIGKKRNGALSQGFLYSSSLRIAAELDGAGNVVSRFVYGDRKNVPEYMIRNGRTYRIIMNQLGSPRLVVDAESGAVAQRIDYDEFGQVIADTNPGFQPFGFGGGLYDAETGLVRFGRRDYDARTGRWTAADPILFSGGDSNLYGYVLSDPINALDSEGLATIQIGISFSASVGNWMGVEGFGIAIDTQGNVGGYTVVGGGAGFGTAEGLGGSVQVSLNAETIRDLRGPFTNFSASAGDGAGGQVDYFTGTGEHGQPVTGFGLTAGEEAGLGVAVTETQTTVHEWGNIFDWFKSKTASPCP